jgi:hypothetical protein
MKYKTYKKLPLKQKRTCKIGRKIEIKYGGNEDEYKNKINSNNTYLNDIEKKVSGITNDITNDVYDTSVHLANKSKEYVIQNINDFIESPKISKIAESGENYLKDINDKIENPVFKKQVNDTLENISDYSELTLKAMDKPIDDAIIKLNDAGTKATSGIVSSSIKVGTDALAAIPGIGAFIELGKIANDASKGVSSVVEASSQAAETVDDFLTETNKNITKLSNIKQQGGEIIDRTIDSINNFHKQIPISSLPSAMKGGNKTKKRFFRRKNKTKRVRFNL